MALSKIDLLPQELLCRFNQGPGASTEMLALRYIDFGSRLMFGSWTLTATGYLTHLETTSAKICILRC
jgi:hypothetical protein